MILVSRVNFMAEYPTSGMDRRIGGNHSEPSTAEFLPLGLELPARARSSRSLWVADSASGSRWIEGEGPFLILFRALGRKCQNFCERHGFSVEIALDIAALGVAEEFDLLGGLDSFAHGFVAEFMAKSDQTGQQDFRLALLSRELG